MQFFQKCTELILSFNLISKNILGAEENLESANTNLANDVQQSQPIFPTSIGSSVICLVDLLFDHELNYNNQSSSIL